MNESHWISGLMQAAIDEAWDALRLSPAQAEAALADWDNHSAAGAVQAQAMISTMPIRMGWLR